jgi:ribosomal protein L11 methyltransferase
VRHEVRICARGIMSVMYRWSRNSTQKHEEEWLLKLAHLDPERVVMLTRPGSKALKVQVFGDRKMVDRLAKAHGGNVTRLTSNIWASDQQRPRAPLSIRGRLKVYSDEAGWRAEPNQKVAILIPAGMAFGTGDHATTATCLRLLCDLLPELPEGWRALDAGTGSGILAIAAERLGAASVQAFDFDPVCIRVARENAAMNGCRAVEIAKADSRKPGAFAKADVVLANLYSELLMESAPALAKRLKPGGWFLFSGVLKTQVDEVCASLEAAGFSKPHVVGRGKWCAGICRWPISEPLVIRPRKSGSRRAR